MSPKSKSRNGDTLADLVVQLEQARSRVMTLRLVYQAAEQVIRPMRMELNAAELLEENLNTRLNIWKQEHGG